MFAEKKCERCGTCLAECPYLELSRETAKEEIVNLIKTRSIGKSLNNCIGCAYCNTLCPTQSEPANLIREINIKSICKHGLPGFYLPSDEIPLNLTSLALKIEPEIKEKSLKVYLNPPKSKEMFYLGCGLTYVYTDLLNTKLLDNIPKIGGIKYCCGSYIKMFGEEEVKIKGEAVLNDFKKLGVQKFILFCPGCLRMMVDFYSKLLPEFQDNFEFQTFSEYLVEKYHRDELNIKTKIDERITFHDPCAWRNLDPKIFEGPRELLEIIGAEVVEMNHNRKKTLCCGSPVSDSDKELFERVSGMRILEAKEIDVNSIAVSCTGCLALAKPSRKYNIETYHIIELAQIAIGEKPPHRIIEVSEKFNKLIENTINKNPDLLNQKYSIKNGKIKRV